MGEESIGMLGARRCVERRRETKEEKDVAVLCSVLLLAYVHDFVFVCPRGCGVALPHSL
jgi:hypothetical protein